MRAGNNVRRATASPRRSDHARAPARAVHAVESLSDAMRAEVRGFGVHVAPVEPIGVPTNFVGRQVTSMPTDRGDGSYREFKQAWIKMATGLFEGNGSTTVPPDRVASAIVHAATAAMPKTRYRHSASKVSAACVRSDVGQRYADARSRAEANITGASSPFRATIPHALAGIVLAGVKGRLSPLRPGRRLARDGVLKVSGRGSHVPSSFDLAPCSGRGRTWEHGRAQKRSRWRSSGRRVRLMRLG
jgi:hypothetical protein